MVGFAALGIGRNKSIGALKRKLDARPELTPAPLRQHGEIRHAF